MDEPWGWGVLAVVGLLAGAVNAVAGVVLPTRRISPVTLRGTVDGWGWRRGAIASEVSRRVS
jgi:hypothetical protein